VRLNKEVITKAIPRFRGDFLLVSF
jgi:hypothetical protein